jgi:hypothetical protein
LGAYTELYNSTLTGQSEKHSNGARISLHKMSTVIFRNKGLEKHSDYFIAEHPFIDWKII